MDAKEMLTETPGSNGHWLLTNRQELLTEHGVDSMHTLYLIDIILSVSGSAMAFGRTISGKDGRCPGARDRSACVPADISSLPADSAIEIRQHTSRLRHNMLRIGSRDTLPFLPNRCVHH